MDNMQKAYWLKMRRKSCGLTQKELAKRSGISLRSVQAYEQGSRDLSGASVDLVRSLCRVLECSEDEILSYPGSFGSLFTDKSDEELKVLYEKMILNRENGAPGEEPDITSQPELRLRLLEEMARRFYHEL